MKSTQADQRFGLIGTWKDRLSVKDSCSLAKAILDSTGSRQLPFRLSIAPPMVALSPVARLVTPRIPLTAQNLVWDDNVSFTGETSANLLRELECSQVIIGHSERRLHLGETEAMIGRKLRAAINHRLIPVLCIGETFEDQQADRANLVIKNQLETLFSAFAQRPRDAAGLVIAYEPAWAISTSREALTCQPSEANSRHQLIRDLVGRQWGNEVATSLSIIYGGSVRPDNVRSYFSQPDIDGGLVGTASQSLDSFRTLIEESEEVFNAKRRT